MEWKKNGFIKQDGDTALYLALFTKNWGLAEYLLDHRTQNVNQIGHEGNNALHLAAEYGKLHIIKKLKKAGTDLHITDSNQDTALHFAAEGGHNEVIEYLLSNGVNINHQNNQGDTPLILSACLGKWHTVKYLIKCHANIHLTSNDGASLLNALKYQELKDLQNIDYTAHKLEILRLIAEQKSTDEDHYNDYGYETNEEDDDSDYSMESEHYEEINLIGNSLDNLHFMGQPD